MIATTEGENQVRTGTGTMTAIGDDLMMTVDIGVMTGTDVGMMT
jgi:hypothetical protein